MCTVPVYRRNFIGLMVLISVISFSSYMLLFSSKGLPGNVLNVTLSYNTAEIIANATGGLVYMRFGAKIAYTGFFVLSIIGGVLMIIFQDN